MSGKNVKAREIMRISLVVLLGLLLNVKECSTQRKCTCKGVKEEVKYVNDNYLRDPTPFQFEGTLKITRDTVEERPELNRHIVYLNRCTGHQVEPTNYFRYYVYKSDIKAWEEYLAANCVRE